MRTEQDEAIRRREIEELERLRSIPGPGEDQAALMEATVTVSRNANDDVQDRTVKLWLDAEEWGTLRYGHSLTRAIAPGRHRVKAHNTLLSSTLDFEAKPGEHVRLRASNTMTHGGMFLMLLIGWAMLRVRLEREE